MPGDLRIAGATPPLTTALSAARASRADTQPAASRNPAAVRVANVAADSTVTLDPTTDRVVQEYFDSSGALTRTTPSRQQLQAYHLAALSAEATGLDR